MVREGDTEQRILEAARRVFHRCGGDGARTRDIADEAGINKALLHYYFRTKANLLDAVFREDFEALWDLQEATIDPDGDLFEVIPAFVANYIDFLREHPYLPQFLTREMIRDPGRLKSRIEKRKRFRIKPAFEKLVRRAVEEGRIDPIDPVHLATHIIGLSVHPFLARPMLQMAHGMNDRQFEVFLEDRKEAVADFVLRALRKCP